MAANQFIRGWNKNFLRLLNAELRKLGIKHNRKQEPNQITSRFKSKKGEIVSISYKLTKGLIMTHRGAGKYPENRKEKPFYTNPADVELPKLADGLAESFLVKVRDYIVKP